MPTERETLPASAPTGMAAEVLAIRGTVGLGRLVAEAPAGRWDLRGPFSTARP